MKAKISFKPLKEGDKVKINFGRIQSRKEYKKFTDKYKTFVSENKNAVFTIEKPSGNLGKMSRTWSFKEDSTDPKWGFHESDLVRVGGC